MATTERGRAMVDRMHRMFVDGYISGEHGNTDSPREVHTMYPSMSVYDVDAYLAGQDDGRRGDLWRIDNMGIGDMLATRRVS